MTKKKKPKFEHSEIPYTERLRMQKQAEIVAHRNEAAAIALQIACVALNNTEGLGYMRLCRFAQETQRLAQEYYADPVIGSAHLQQRLKQLGFIIVDGHIMAAENAETGQIVPTKKLEEQNEKQNEKIRKNNPD